MLYFLNTSLAAAAVPSLADTAALSVEIMDYASVLSTQNTPIWLPEFNTLPANSTALLLDFAADSMEEMEDVTQTNLELIKKLQGLQSMDPFTKTIESREKLWKIRDGIFPCVAGVRGLGDTVILEDVVAPVPDLHQLVSGIQSLFTKY